VSTYGKLSLTNCHVNDFGENIIVKGKSVLFAFTLMVESDKVYGFFIDGGYALRSSFHCTTVGISLKAAL
jgi:hypothetical protein